MTPERIRRAEGLGATGDPRTRHGILNRVLTCIHRSEGEAS